MTDESDIPKEILEYYECKLLHKTTPYLTNRSIWNEVEKKWYPEIIHICQECQKIKG